MIKRLRRSSSHCRSLTNRCEKNSSKNDVLKQTTIASNLPRTCATGLDETRARPWQRLSKYQSAKMSGKVPLVSFFAFYRSYSCRRRRDVQVCSAKLACRRGFFGLLRKGPCSKRPVPGKTRCAYGPVALGCLPRSMRLSSSTVRRPRISRRTRALLNDQIENCTAGCLLYIRTSRCLSSVS